jgi:hypothetical protein
VLCVLCSDRMLLRLLLLLTVLLLNDGLRCDVKGCDMDRSDIGADALARVLCATDSC